MKKKILFTLLILIIVGVAVGFYLYNKPHKNYAKLKADYIVTAEELFAEFEENESSANEKYLDEVVQVRGIIAGITEVESALAISLYDQMFGVTCTLDKEAFLANQTLYSNLIVGQQVILKGRCDGMLTDVRLSRCSIVNE